MARSPALIERPRRHVLVQRDQLRKVLGVWGLFSIGYSNVGSSIYYALGLTAVFALGATPLALGIAGVVFVFVAMTYAETGAMMPVTGGSLNFTRKAFNDVVAFVGGWALMLDFLITMAISAAAIAPYLGLFYEPLKSSQGMIATFGIAAVVGLTALNLVGVRESSRMNVAFCVLDLVTQVTLVVLGLVALLDLPRVISYVDWTGTPNWPTPSAFLYSLPVAMVAYTGIESVVQMSGETKMPERAVPNALKMSVFAVLFMYGTISLIALSAMTPPELAGQWASDPIAGIATKLPTFELFGRTIDLPHYGGIWVAILAASILLLATNAGLMGASRLSFQMSALKDLPSALRRIHPQWGTPYVTLVAAGVCATALILVSLTGGNVFKQLADAYAFGALLDFTILHLSVIVMRFREPDAPRPFRIPFNLRFSSLTLPLPVRRNGLWQVERREFRNVQIPIPAVLGFLCTSTVWVLLVLEHPFGRWVGFGWLALGVIGYTLYRRSQHLPIAEAAVTAEVDRVSFEPVGTRSILVPTGGSAKSEPVQTACKIAKMDKSRVVAVYVVEVPMVLPVDADMTAEIRKAESALDIAETIAREHGVKIESHIVQGRFAGAAIVEEARKLGADLIVLGASRKTSVGEIVFGRSVTYVIKNAPCRVWTISTPVEQALPQVV